MGAIDDLEARAVAKGLATAAELRAALRTRRRSKFGARRARAAVATAATSRLYDSEAERDRAAELRLLEAAGEISGLEEQPRLEIERLVFYRPDFKYVERDGRLVYEDVKGAEGERWRVIVRLWAIHGPAPLLVTKRARKRDGFRVVRVVTPQPIGVRELLATVRSLAGWLERGGEPRGGAMRMQDWAARLKAEARAYETGEVAAWDRK